MPEISLFQNFAMWMPSELERMLLVYILSETSTQQSNKHLFSG